MSIEVYTIYIICINISSRDINELKATREGLGAAGQCGERMLQVCV